MKTSEILWAAREEIAKGWCKNTLQNPQGKVCAAGALQRVILQTSNVYGKTWDDDLIKQYETAAAALVAAIPECPMIDGGELDGEGHFIIKSIPSIPLWNDNPRRIQQDVMDTFEKAAIMAEEAGL